MNNNTTTTTTTEALIVLSEEQYTSSGDLPQWMRDHIVSLIHDEAGDGWDIDVYWTDDQSAYVIPECPAELEEPVKTAFDRLIESPGTPPEEPEPTTTTTIAIQISALLGDDGQQFRAEDGRSLGDLAREYGGRQETTIPADKCRYIFPDGSVITVAGAAWDLGCPDCWGWMGEGHEAGCPRLEKPKPAPTPDPYASIVAAIEAAQGCWCGWDWAQDFAVPGKDRVVFDGEPSEEVLEALPPDVRDKIIVYRNACAADARQAELQALDALASLSEGNFTDATAYLEGAVDLEKQWGDAPVWGPPLRLAAELEEEDEEEDDLREEVVSHVHVHKYAPEIDLEGIDETVALVLVERANHTWHVECQGVDLGEAPQALLERN